MSTLLATGARAAHTLPFDQLAQERLGELDVAALLVYLVDTVSADALPFLAEQFNVQGLKGYALAETEQERRDLISVAIDLNKLKGTPFAVRRAILTLDYTDVLLRENSALTCNGSWELDGLNTCGSTNFSNVVIRIATDDPTTAITADQVSIALAVANEYRNARTNISKIGFKAYDYTYAPDYYEFTGWVAFLQGTQWYLWPMVDSPEEIETGSVTNVLVNGTTIPIEDFIIVEQIA